MVKSFLSKVTNFYSAILFKKDSNIVISLEILWIFSEKNSYETF